MYITASSGYFIFFEGTKRMGPYFFLSILPFCVCVVLSAVGVKQELSERIQVAVLSVAALLAVFFFCC
jgi:hypothetical protein